MPAATDPMMTPAGAVMEACSRPDVRELPMIRVDRLLFRSKLLAVYQDHVLAGTRYFRDLKLSEEMCHPQGEAQLRGLLHRCRSMRFEDVAEVRETGMIVDDEMQSGRVWSGRNVFKLVDRRGQKLRSPVRLSEVGNIRECFQAEFGGRYLQGLVKQRSSVVNVLLLLSAVLGILFGCIFIFAAKSQEAVAWPVKLLETVALVAAVFWVVWPRKKWLVAGSATTGKKVGPVRPKMARVGKSPTRSVTAGWLLKLAGFAYWLLFAEWLSVSASTVLEKMHLGNNMQAQVLVSFLVHAPVVALIWYGYRLSQRRYEPKSQTDTRRPIVFLRPFEDDNHTTLQPAGWVAALTGVRSSLGGMMGAQGQMDGRIQKSDVLVNSQPVRLFRMLCNIGCDTSEEALVRYFDSVGPMIAIGRPAETLATPGAARMYLPDSDWQQAVHEELVRAQFIVLQPGTSEGVVWELQHLKEHCEPHRVLVCLVSFWRHPDSFEKVCRIFRNTLGCELPKVVPFLDWPAFVYFDGDWQPRLQPLSYRCPLLWPLVGDATDLNYTLQPFLQGVHGGEREAPRKPKWTGWLSRGPLGVCAAALGFALSVAIGTGMYLLGNVVMAREMPEVAEHRSAVAEAVQMLRESRRMQLRGKAVPYVMTVPTALLQQPITEEMIEHSRRSPDGTFSLEVVANKGREPIDNLAMIRAEMFRKGGAFNAVEVVSTRSVEMSGLVWVESRLRLTGKNGGVVREICYATNSPKGMVLLVFNAVEAEVFDRPYDALTDEIMRSVHLE